MEARQLFSWSKLKFLCCCMLYEQLCFLHPSVHKQEHPRFTFERLEYLGQKIQVHPFYSRSQSQVCFVFMRREKYLCIFCSLEQSGQLWNPSKCNLPCTTLLSFWATKRNHAALDCTFFCLWFEWNSTEMHVIAWTGCDYGREAFDEPSRPARCLVGREASTVVNKPSL
jgi:hypothetical protein